MSLHGQAQSVLSNMNENERQNYGALTQRLKERFAPPTQTELHRVQLKERTHRPGETLPEPTQGIMRLVKMTPSSACRDARHSSQRKVY